MTRKDYVLITNCMNHCKPTRPDEGLDYEAEFRFDGAVMQWKNDCNALADILARDNERFDRARFLNACGM